MSDFLKKDYTVPSDSKYLNKFPQGETNFRILSSAVVGYEYWREDNQPVRLKEMWKKKPADIKVKDNGGYETKHFWAFVVWHYEENKIKIMQITQKTIMNPLKALVDNTKWGDPKSYDITIAKEGEMLKTKYTVVPSPKTDIQQEILDEYKENPINLEALFENGDPFEASEQVKTQEQIDEEEEVLRECDKL